MRALMDRPLRKLSHQLAYRTISDDGDDVQSSDEGDSMFTGRSSTLIRTKTGDYRSKLRYIDKLLDDLSESKTRRLLSAFLKR